MYYVSLLAPTPNNDGVGYYYDESGLSWFVSLLSLKSALHQWRTRR